MPAELLVDHIVLSESADRHGRLFIKDFVIPAKYHLQVRADGFATWADTVSITNEAGVRLTVRLTRISHR